MPAIALEQKYAAALSEIAGLREQLQAAQNQLEWFKRQLFGRKSEKLLAIDPAVQQSLLAALGEEAAPPPPVETETVTIKRRRKGRDGAVNDTGLRFDESVPVRVIDIPPPKGLESGEIIDVRSTYRLAQRRASYVVLEYRCPVIRAAQSATITTTPVPGNLFEGSPIRRRCRVHL